MIAVALLAVVAGTQSVQIRVDGRDRRYLLHLPALRSAPSPLVLAFHGGANTPENMETTSGFSALADREHLIVAYPEAAEKYWNDGRGTMPPADDIAFTRAVISDIQRSYRIDTKRIYATGVSNGGIFSNRLGCEMADTFAAVGPVIGTLASNLASACHPSQPISVIGIVAVDDPRVPFAGGETGGPTHAGIGGKVEGARTTEELWAKFDECHTRPSLFEKPPRVDDGTSVTRRTYRGCKDGTAVVWYEIAGGGHRWPPYQPQSTEDQRVATETYGKSSRNLDATATLWQFFKTHRKR